MNRPSGMKSSGIVMWIFAVICALLVGCTSVPESDETIQQSDLVEVDFMREIMSDNPDAEGKYEVIPGSSVTTVKMFEPPKPADEVALRESMIEIKETIRKRYGHEPNKLRFVFDEVIIEE